MEDIEGNEKPLIVDVDTSEKMSREMRMKVITMWCEAMMVQEVNMWGLMISGFSVVVNFE